MKLLPGAGPERTRALALLAILGALVVWAWWSSAPESTVVTAAGPAPEMTQATSAPAAPGALASLELPEQINLSALERQPAVGAVGRNLFRFGARPAPPPPPLAEALVPVGPPVPEVPAGPPPISLRMTGRFESPGGKVVVTLKDPESGALFHASEGDIVDGRYRLVKVGTTSAVLAYLDGSGQRTVMLGGG